MTQQIVANRTGMLFLAPMEGLVDALMRDLITSVGGVDVCVTEFLRISDQRLPDKVFKRLCPEAESGWKTPAGTPVVLQLLGSNPELMAESAVQGVQLGAPAIDINFGCPAKTVNKNRGGSVLLQEPEIVYAIVKAMRDAVPSDIPVTAKMRLGYQDASLALENAQAVEAGGAAQLVIHARTKVEGYKPPAHWHALAPLREKLSIPVVANGEIWTLEDYIRCREISGCEDIMLGRGLVSKPWLCEEIKAWQRQEVWQDNAPAIMAKLLDKFIKEVQAANIPRYAMGRAKQWLKMIREAHPLLNENVESWMRIKDPEALFSAIHRTTDGWR
ncbi:tRNA dihydrouridine synthase [Pokkaliibacter sp. CJK22405]|uniref:tRNA dihydrouridine synthase n=1 Tax=Pokkaliibacter sp. CJK22405 TaxID=3384615 RepID=UPI00398554BE